MLFSTGDGTIKNFTIKKKSDIQSMKECFLKSNLRDYLLFTLGINTGIRLQDLLYLEVRDLMVDRKSVEILQVKGELFPLNNDLRKEIECVMNEICVNKKESNYIFTSESSSLPIDRSHVYRILNKCAKKVGIENSISTQSLRKTFGYHYLKAGGDIHELRKILGGRSCEETKKYVEYDVKFNYSNFFL